MSSCQHLVWALRQRGLTAAERVVLIYLADRANGQLFCWPSIPTIAEDCELSVRKVRDAVHRLEELDMIRIEDKAGEKTHTFHILRVSPANSAAAPGKICLPPAEFAGSDSHNPGRICRPPPAEFASESLKEESLKEARKQEPPYKPPQNLPEVEPHAARAATLPRGGESDLFSHGDSNSEANAVANAEHVEPPDPVQRSPSAQRKRTTDDPEFDAFWREYPRKAAKGAAERAWPQARKLAALGAIMAGLRRCEFSADPQYIPHPATWLNQRRWEDAPLPPPDLMRRDPSKLSGPALALYRIRQEIAELKSAEASQRGALLEIAT